MSGDSKSTNCPSCPSLVGSLGLLCRYKRFLFWFGCSCRPSTKYFFLIVHYFNSFVLIAQQTGQANVPGRLSTVLQVCGHAFLSIVKATCPTTANENKVYTKAQRAFIYRTPDSKKIDGCVKIVRIYVFRSTHAQG
jgi:hypothetical protein